MKQNLLFIWSNRWAVSQIVTQSNGQIARQVFEGVRRVINTGG